MYASGYRSLGKMLLILAAIPGFYYVVTSSVAYVSEPTLYEGDRLETRPCHECGGSGKDAELEREVPELGGRCAACAGKGSVEVILPGPERPTRIWGAVVDAEDAGGPLASIPASLVRRMPHGGLLPAGAGPGLPGAIAEAAVTFERAGASALHAKSDPAGRFTQRLPSGPYRVLVQAPGRARLEEEIEIPPLEDPIWLEKATIVRESASSTESQGVYGLVLILGMAKPDEGGAFVRLCAASP